MKKSENKIKGVLLDIDNTLYDYEPTHAEALDVTLSLFNNNTGLDKRECFILYNKARSQIQLQLKNTASSHNRLLYFQRMCELLELKNISLAFESYNLYWDSFINNIKLFDGVLDFLKKTSTEGIKVAVITDLTADVQHKKLHTLGIIKYIDFLVTSEEAGADKPDPAIFYLALKKINLEKEVLVMVGDSFDKDVIGANNLGIASFWLNRGNPKSIKNKNIPNMREFSTFREIKREIIHGQ